MNNKIKALITGLGGPLGVTILKALNMSKLETEVIGTDITPDSVGLFRVDRGYLLPPALEDEAKYLAVLAEICVHEKIDIIFPGSEQEMKVLAQVKDEFLEETGALVVVNEPEILEITTDKWKTVALLEEVGIPVPFSVLPENVKEILKRFDFPLLIKPRFSSGSKGLNIVRDEEELDFYIRKTNNPIIQELLMPAEEEYTVGLFMDEPGHCIGTIIMKRFLAAGLTYKAEVLEDIEIDRVCRETVKVLKLNGPCNIQLRKTAKGPQIFEINPRFSSTTVMRAYFGFNEPEMAIRKFLLDEQIEPPQVTKGYALRFWHEVYVTGNELAQLGQNGIIIEGEGKIIDNI